MAAIVPLRLSGLLLCIFYFSLSPIFAQTALNDTVTAQLLLQEATLLNDSMQYKRAEIPARKAYDIYHSSFERNNEKIAAAALQLGKTLGRQSKTSEALSILQEAIDTWSVLYPQGAVQTANAWFEKGVALQRGGSLKEALDAHQQSFSMRQRLLPENDPQMAASWREMGEVLFTRGYRTEAIPYLEKSLHINTQIYGPESKVVAEELSNLSRGFMYLGEFEQAITSAEKALAIQQKILPPAPRDLASTYYTLGMCYENLNRFDDALVYFLKSLEIKQHYFSANPSVFPGTYSEIGKVWLGKKDYRTAFGYFEKADSIMVQMRADTQWTYAYSCHNMGRVQFALKNYDLSVKWYLKDISLLRKAYKNDNEEIGVLLTELGNSQTANGDFQNALISFQAASKIFSENLGPDNTSQYLAESGTANLYRELYLRTDDGSDLENSRTFFKAAEKSVDRLIRFENASLIRKKWLTDTKKIFGQAIATEMLFLQRKNDPNALENAWQLSETMHGFELFAVSQEANARQYAAIPDDLLQQEKSLRTNMIALQKERQQLMEDQDLEITDSLVLDNNARYFGQKEKYSQLVAGLEKNYPDYFQLKYQFSNISIAATQRMLSKDQTLLEYFAGDSVIYIFVIQSDTSHLVEVPRDFPLTDWVSQFRQGIMGYHISTQKSAQVYAQSVQQYAHAAQQLYDRLIAPVAAVLRSEVLVVPDGALNYVPFEALLSGAPKDLSNFKTYPFWVNQKAVGYANSATILHQMITKKHRIQPSGTLLAFAPFFFGDTTKVSLRVDQEMAMRKGFRPLPNTGEEILRAQKRLGGQSAVFYGKTATVEQFKTLAPGFSILHLATHGKANERTGEFSFLAFYSPSDSASGGHLYVSDLYNLTLNADLVLLSACETGMGELFEGEGVVSLARAFSFAGAKSVVTSLWSVNDQSSLFLMDDFYTELKLGKTKNIALSTAKRNYMKEHPGEAAHPFFWAGFVGVGDWSKLK